MFPETLQMFIVVVSHLIPEYKILVLERCDMTYTVSMCCDMTYTVSMCCDMTYTVSM
jgi:hypothetical protein